MRYLFIFSILLFSFCTNSEDVSGGSEIGSPTFSGILDSTASTGTRVRLIPANYYDGQDSTTILETQTTSSGRFEFPNLDTTNSYSVLIEEENGKVFYHPKYSFSEKGMDMGTLSLHTPTNLSIQLKKDGKPMSDYDIILIGTTWMQTTNKDGQCFWKAIPECIFSVYVRPKGSAEKPVYVQDIDVTSTTTSFEIQLPSQTH